MPSLPAEATIFLIVFARVGAVLMLLPLFSDDAVPMRLRLLMALGMAAGLWGVIGPKVAPAAAEGVDLAAIVIAELFVGIAMGMIVRILFQAAAMAGSVISLQIGLSAAMLFDPAQGAQSPLIGKVVSVAALVVCLGIGVHHLWIASIVQSYALFPVGGLPPADDFAMLAVGVTGRAMALTLSLAAPLIVYGIVFNVALGLTARMAPAIQVFFIAQPLNLLIGLGIFAATIGVMLGTFSEEMAAFMQNGWS